MVRWRGFGRRIEAGGNSTYIHCFNWCSVFTNVLFLTPHAVYFCYFSLLSSQTTIKFAFISISTLSGCNKSKNWEGRIHLNNLHGGISSPIAASLFRMLNQNWRFFKIWLLSDHVNSPNSFYGKMGKLILDNKLQVETGRSERYSVLRW